MIEQYPRHQDHLSRFRRVCRNIKLHRRYPRSWISRRTRLSSTPCEAIAYLAVGRMVALGFERRERKSLGGLRCRLFQRFLKGFVSLSLTLFVPCRGRPLTPDTRTPGGNRKGSNFRNAPYCVPGGFLFIRRGKTMAEKCKPHILFKCNFGGTNSQSAD